MASDFGYDCAFCCICIGLIIFVVIGVGISDLFHRQNYYLGEIFTICDKKNSDENPYYPKEQDCLSFYVSDFIRGEEANKIVLQTNPRAKNPPEGQEYVLIQLTGEHKLAGEYGPPTIYFTDDLSLELPNRFYPYGDKDARFPNVKKGWSWHVLLADKNQKGFSISGGFGIPKSGLSGADLVYFFLEKR